MLAKIKTWLKTRRHKKHYKKLKNHLLSHPNVLLERKAAFEKAFGVNSRMRTFEQWQRLVNVYGIEQVCKSENMTRDEVIKMTTETYDQKLKRRLRK